MSGKRKPQKPYVKKKKERNNEKAEKYYTNEGTNQNHKSPNKLRGNRKKN